MRVARSCGIFYFQDLVSRYEDTSFRRDDLGRRRSLISTTNHSIGVSSKHCIRAVRNMHGVASLGPPNITGYVSAKRQNNYS
jgi:hypothetical protein